MNILERLLQQRRSQNTQLSRSIERTEQSADPARRFLSEEYKEMARNAEESAQYKGKHYTKYVDEVKLLKRKGQLQEAESLLLHLVDAVEAEAAAFHWDRAIAPWCYEQLAIVYRKQYRYAEEIAILDRYLNVFRKSTASQRQTWDTDRLPERRKKAIALLEKQTSQGQDDATHS